MAYKEDVSERVCAKQSFYKTKGYYEPACFEKITMSYSQSPQGKQNPGETKSMKQ